MPDIDASAARYKRGLLVALFAATFVLILTGFSVRLDNWSATHWLFTYEHGFIKRALAGTLLSIGFDTVSATTMFTVHFAVALLTSLVFAALVFVVTARAFEPDGEAENPAMWMMALILGVFLLSSPGAIQQFVYDKGRFDALGFLLICLSYFCVRMGSVPIGLLAVTVFSVIAVLVHEAFVLWVAPMSLGLWLWVHGAQTRHVVAAGGVTALLAGLTAMVWMSDYAEIFSFDAAKAMLQNRAGFPVSELGVMVHYRDLSDNFAYTSERAWSFSRLVGLAVGAAFLGALVILILRLFSRSGLALGRREGLLVALCFLPLALLLMGHDQGRWISMINCSLVLVVLAWLDDAPGRIRHLSWRHGGLLTIGILVQLGLGPLGVTHLFPRAGFWQFVVQPGI